MSSTHSVKRQRVAKLETDVLEIPKQNEIVYLSCKGVYPDYPHIVIRLLKGNDGTHYATLSDHRKDISVHELTETETTVVKNAMKNLGTGYHTILEIWHMIRRIGKLKHVVIKLR